jgi:hypothetical protein
MTAAPDERAGPGPRRGRLAGAVAFFRVRDWYPLVGIALLGYAYRLPHLEAGPLAALLAATALYLAHGYGLNRYGDLRSGELVDAPSTVELEPRTGLLLSMLFLLAAIVLASLALPLPVAGALAGGGGASLLYSSPVPRLKRRLGWNLVLNSSGFTVLFLAGFLTSKGVSPTLPLLVGYVWLGVVPFQVIHLMSHREIEGSFRLSARAWSALYHAALALWVGYTLAVSVLWHRSTLVLAALTCAYGLIQVVVVRRKKAGDELTAEAAARARRWLGLANVAFGTLLLALFLLT